MANEIEKKFIVMCDEFEVKSMATKAYSIIQTYLFAEHGERRVRERKDLETGVTQFFYTEKIKISESNRIENEYDIPKDVYDRAIQEEADPDLHPINKTRYVVPFGDVNLEIDFYPWDSRSILEIELPYEDFPINLASIPPFITIIQDVTFDSRYKNNALAKTLAFPGN